MSVGYQMQYTAIVKGGRSDFAQIPGIVKQVLDDYTARLEAARNEGKLGWDLTWCYRKWTQTFTEQAEEALERAEEPMFLHLESEDGDDTQHFTSIRAPTPGIVPSLSKQRRDSGSPCVAGANSSRWCRIWSLPWGPISGGTLRPMGLSVRGCGRSGSFCTWRSTPIPVSMRPGTTTTTPNAISCSPAMARI